MTCCIFSLKQVNNQDIDLEFLEDFGDTYYNEAGEVVHYLHTWDEGRRILAVCRKCGELVLRQSSEFHSYEDSYYESLFPVDSREEALYLNKTYGGYDLEMKYSGWKLFQTNGEWSVPFKDTDD